MNFTAIDFETATGDRASICQVGLVIVEQCKIVDRIKYMVQPPDNKYSERNIAVHGITPEMTDSSPTFKGIYDDICKLVHSRQLVAHNAIFDISCLNSACKKYNLPVLVNNWYCTKKIHGVSLKDACAAHGIIYTAHDALSDAEACAQLMIKDIIRHGK